MAMHGEASEGGVWRRSPRYGWGLEAEPPARVGSGGGAPGKGGVLEAEPPVRVGCGGGAPALTYLEI